MAGKPILIADTGETLIYAEWLEDPAVIEGQILKMADAWDDWSTPMIAARQILIEDTRKHFDTETDPDGVPWKALTENYAKYREGGSDHILVLSGDLERAATSEAAWFVAADRIMFRADALPFYGPYHQTGTQGGEKAGHYASAIEKATSGQFGSLTASEVAAFSGGGRGLNLPQRRFIGASEEALNEIEAVFLAHLDRTVTEPWSEPPPIAGEGVFTTSGLFGTLTNVPSFGGGFLVRGESGRFIGVFRGL